MKYWYFIIMSFGVISGAAFGASEISGYKVNDAFIVLYAALMIFLLRGVLTDGSPFSKSGMLLSMILSVMSIGFGIMFVGAW